MLGGTDMLYRRKPRRRAPGMHPKVGSDCALVYDHDIERMSQQVAKCGGVEEKPSDVFLPPEASWI